MPDAIDTLAPRHGGQVTAEAESDMGSARRLLRVLLSFKAVEPFATADQLARRTGLPLSSTYRYLSMLREVGLVEDNGKQGFNIGAASIRLAEAARAANPLERLARPYLRQLVDAADETALLLRRVNDKAICVDGIEARQIIRSPVKVGSMVPIYVGAGPKVLMAGLPDVTREHILQHCIQRHRVDAASAEKLRAELARIASSGLAVAHRDVFRDVSGMAAPIRNGSCCVAALVVAVPSFRFDAPAEARLRRLVLGTAAAISAVVSAQHDRPVVRGRDPEGGLENVLEGAPDGFKDGACAD